MVPGARTARTYPASSRTMLVRRTREQNLGTTDSDSFANLENPLRCSAMPLECVLLSLSANQYCESIASSWQPEFSVPITILDKHCRVDISEL